MPATRERWTAEAVRALPDDGNRYELIDGELLVTPAPRFAHQRAVGQMFRTLDKYLSRVQIGELVVSPADIELEQDTIVQPDLFVVPVSGDVRFAEWPEIKELLLACEVLSPGTARYDRVTKRRFFARAAVHEYWVVDLDAEVIERSRRGDERVEVIADDLVWQPAGATTALTIDLATFFRNARGA